ncbi:MAG: hypothetical protein R3E48_20665 [Burkholderiaceae bacterium]
MSVGDLNRVEQFEAESGRLELLYVDVAVANADDQGCHCQSLDPGGRARGAMVTNHGFPIAWASGIVRLSRAAYCESALDRVQRDEVVVVTVNAIGAALTHGGFWKCSNRARADGHGWSHKRVHQIDRQMWLNLEVDRCG